MTVDQTITTIDVTSVTGETTTETGTMEVADIRRERIRSLIGTIDKVVTIVGRIGVGIAAMEIEETSEGSIRTTKTSIQRGIVPSSASGTTTARIGTRRRRDLDDLTTETEVIRDRRASPRDLLRAATVEQLTTAVTVEGIAIIVVAEATATSTIAVVVIAFLTAEVVEGSVVAAADIKMIGGSEEELKATILSWPRVLTKSR